MVLGSKTARKRIPHQQVTAIRLQGRRGLRAVVAGTSVVQLDWCQIDTTQVVDAFFMSIEQVS